MSIAEHLDDIDFRTHEARQADALTEIKGWHDIAFRKAMKDPSERHLANLQVLSSVLWLLMDSKDYEKLTRDKKGYIPTIL